MAQVRISKRGKTFSYIFEAGKIDGKRKVVEKGGYSTKAEVYKAGFAMVTGNKTLRSISSLLRRAIEILCEEKTTFPVEQGQQTRLTIKAHDCILFQIATA